MQIEVTEKEYCRLMVHYEADTSEIEAKKSQVVTMFKKAPVPGFRQGKADELSIRLHYKHQIEEALKRALAEDAYHNTMYEKNIKPLGQPAFTSMLLADGKFVCEFRLDKKPDFEVPELKTLDVPKPHPPAQDVTSFIEKMMQDLRIKFGESTPYKDSDVAENNDNIIIDYVGKVDGEVVPSLVAQGETITVGTNNLKGFDDQLIGMKAGEVKTFELLVPEGSSIPSISNKTATFEVTLVMGMKVTPAPLDDDLAKKLGKENLDELRQEVGKIAFGRIENEVRQNLLGALANVLLASVDVKVPEWLALAEAQYVVRVAKLDWEGLSDKDKQHYMDMGNRNVKLSLVLDKIRDNTPEAQLSDQEVLEILKKTVDLTSDLKKLAESGYLQVLFAKVRDEFTLDYIAKTVRIVD